MALTPAIRDIKQRFPRSVVRTFIDDRTFVSPTAVEVCDVRGAWDEWSTKLGLTENRDKTAIFHAKATGQRALRAKGVVPDPCPKILGVELQGIKQRANTSRENKRIQESKNLPAKSTCLPLSWWEKQKVLNGAVLGKVTWGWMFDPLPSRCPVAKTSDCPYSRALHEHGNANPDLRSILRGHSLNIRFRILQANVRAAWRLAKKFVRPCACSFKGWPKVITKGMEYFGWPLVRPWEWQHPTLGAVQLHHVPADPPALERVQRVLRESMRIYYFQQFLQWGRREAEECSQNGVTYLEARCTKAPKMCNSQKRFTVLAGGTISPAAISIMRGLDAPSVCPWCGEQQVPTLEHVAWQCTGLDEVRIQHHVQNIRISCPSWVANLDGP